METNTAVNIQDMNDDQIYEAFLETSSHSGRGPRGDSVMGAYTKYLKVILDKVEKDDKINPKMIAAGPVANMLSRLFTHLPEGDRYGRSYRYLRQMEGKLEKWGWKLTKIDNSKMIVKVPSTTPAADTTEGTETAAE